MQDIYKRKFPHLSKILTWGNIYVPTTHKKCKGVRDSPKLMAPIAILSMSVCKTFAGENFCYLK